MHSSTTSDITEIDFSHWGLNWNCRCAPEILLFLYWMCVCAHRNAHRRLWIEIDGTSRPWVANANYKTLTWPDKCLHKNTRGVEEKKHTAVTMIATTKHTHTDEQRKMITIIFYGTRLTFAVNKMQRKPKTNICLYIHLNYMHAQNHKRDACYALDTKKRRWKKKSHQRARSI